MKQAMIDRFKRNEAENTIFAAMLNESMQKSNDVFKGKFDLKSVETLSKKEMKLIISEF